MRLICNRVVEFTIDKVETKESNNVTFIPRLFLWCIMVGGERALNLLVAKFLSHKQEACLQYTHRYGNRDCVKILQTYFCNLQK